MSSLLSRDPRLALRCGSVRITFVAAEEDERPSIQVIDPAPLNYVVNNGLELMRFLETARNTGATPTSIASYNGNDEVVGEFQVMQPIGRLVLNFLELGSAAAAFILLMTGTSPQEIDWSKVFPAEITGNPKAPEEVEQFIRWHLIQTAV